MFLPLKYSITIVQKYAGSFFTLWLLLSFIFTHMPLPDTRGGIPHVDKISHFFIYLLLSFFLSLWWNKQGTFRFQKVIVLFVMLLIYAFIDEALQTFVARTPDIRDIAADIVGIITGIYLSYKIQTKFLGTSGDNSIEI